jgi:hypothetical protein
MLYRSFGLVPELNFISGPEEERMYRRTLTTRAAVLAVLSVGCAAASAQTLWSWEAGTPDGWGATNDIDTGWSDPQPRWTNKSIGPFGATDGNNAYTFHTPDTAAFSFAEGTQFQASVINGIDPVLAARWDALVANNLIFFDLTIEGQRTAPLDPNNANYVAFWPALNGPSAAGGFIGSYDNPIDLNSGATPQYQLVYSTEYYTGARTRTMTWDYVNAGYDLSLVTPTNDSDNWTFMYLSTNSNTTGLHGALDNIRVYRAKATDPTWGGTASGNWSAAGSWSNGVPNAVGAIASLKYSSASTAVAISLDTNVTVGSIVINNAPRNALGAPLGNASGNPVVPATTYTITAPGTQVLSLDNGTKEASLVVTANAILNAPLNVASNAVIDLTGDVRTGNQDGVPGTSGATLTTKNITIAAGKTLRTTSVGELTVDGNIVGGADSALNVHGHKTTITAGGSRMVKVDNLSIATSAQLDLTNNAAIVDYTGASPIAAIQAAIASGYAAGAWTGKGIVSSTAAGNGAAAIGYVEASSVGLAGGNFAGQALTGDAVLIRYTLKGDTDLNRLVNFDDLLALAQGYGAAGGWRQGDTNYDLTVNFDDLLALAQNYGGSLSLVQGDLLASVGGESFAHDFSLALSLVPEPASLAAIASVACVARRRRI